MTDQEVYDELTQDEKDALDLMGQGHFPETPNEAQQAVLDSLVEKGFVRAIQHSERDNYGWFELQVYDNHVDDLVLYSHIIPSGDTLVHEAEADGCWCDPFMDPETMTWHHHAKDGREEYEYGLRKPH